MDATKAPPAPRPRKRLTLRQQLAIYDDFLTLEDSSVVAKVHRIPVEAVERICEMVPSKYVPLTDLRRARAIARCEELASAVCDRLEERLRADGLTNGQLIEILDSMARHLASLIATKTPGVQVNEFNYNFTADQLLQIQRDAESKTSAAAIGGNGNRLQGL